MKTREIVLILPSRPILWQAHMPRAANRQPLAYVLLRVPNMLPISVSLANNASNTPGLGLDRVGR